MGVLDGNMKLLFKISSYDKMAFWKIYLSKQQEIFNFFLWQKIITWKTPWFLHVPTSLTKIQYDPKILSVFMITSNLSPVAIIKVSMGTGSTSLPSTDITVILWSWIYKKGIRT